jgi:hypothetical protein
VLPASARRANGAQLTVAPETLKDSGHLATVARTPSAHPPLFVSQRSGGDALPANPVTLCGGQRHGRGLHAVHGI